MANTPMATRGHMGGCTPQKFFRKPEKKTFASKKFEKIKKKFKKFKKLI
jgi:hypothetical protein